MHRLCFRSLYIYACKGAGTQYACASICTWHLRECACSTKHPISHSRQTLKQTDTKVLLVKHGSIVLMLCLSRVGVWVGGSVGTMYLRSGLVFGSLGGLHLG